MKRKIAIINQKGGVGKTTTTAHLGAALARAGKRTLVIDLDSQGHLSLHLGVEVGEGDATIYDVLTDGASLAETAKNPSENLFVIPSDIDLAAAESELVSVTGREVLLREAIERVEDDYDFLLIDCPPSLGVLTINALAACDEVIIPLQAQFFALQGLSKLLANTVTLVRKRINPSLTVAGVVLCMHDPSTKLSTEVVEDLSSFLESSRSSPVAWAEAKIYETPVRRNIKLAEAASFGQTVFDYAPGCNGAKDYAALAREVFGITGKKDKLKAKLAEAPRQEAAPAPVPAAPAPATPLPAAKGKTNPPTQEPAAAKAAPDVNAAAVKVEPRSGAPKSSNSSAGKPSSPVKRETVPEVGPPKPTRVPPSVPEPVRESA